ncbi:MAG TPA: thioredoxin family protein [Pirellulaceae bacterium]|nr:thioredoxin family protein [Pirellulaceae bacterium]
MKSIHWMGVAIVLALAGLARGQDQVPWAGDFQQACQQAAQQHKLVLLHFYSDDCPPCVRVEQNVFANPEAAQAIARNYVPLKVHVKQNPQLAARYQITRWPTDVAVTPVGLEVHRSTSPQSAEHYIELVDLIALKGGVGAGRQWALDMQQVGQATLAQAGAAAAGAAGEARQQWDQTAQQFQGAADQARGAATQWGQQAQAATQQYSQQAQDAIAQYQQQAQGTFQQFNQQAQGAAQQFQESTQQFVDAARPSATQWKPYADPAELRGAGPSAGAGAFAAAAGQAAANVGSPPQTGIVNPFFGAPSPAAPGGAPQQTPQSFQAEFQPQQEAATQYVAASQAPPVAMEGYCPVTLIEMRKWMKADPQFGAIHRGRTYLFAGAEQQQKFLANPDAFAPVLSGYDPVRFATTGQLVDGKRGHGIFNPEDKRIYLFADEAALEQFKQSPRAYAEPAYQAMMRSESATTYR